MPFPSSHFPITEELRRAKVDWQKTPESPYLFEAVWNGREIRLRLNDFPDEPICTLLVGAQETQLDEFPKGWTLPRHREEQ